MGTITWMPPGHSYICTTRSGLEWCGQVSDQTFHTACKVSPEVAISVVHKCFYTVHPFPTHTSLSKWPERWPQNTPPPCDPALWQHTHQETWWTCHSQPGQTVAMQGCDSNSGPSLLYCLLEKTGDLKSIITSHITYKKKITWPYVTVILVECTTCLHGGLEIHSYIHTRFLCLPS